MKLFLHIGLNKTGTSSLQNFCHQNREVLRDAGLEYPQSAIHDSAHYGVTKSLMGMPGGQHVKGSEGIAEEISAAIAERRDVLISSEYFFLASDEQVRKIKDFFSGFDAECRILVYLRRHDDWITSLFNQALKTSARKPWHSDIREYTLHLIAARDIEVRYPVIVDRWAKQFGQRNIIVRPFELGQFRDGEFLWDALGSVNAEIPGKLIKSGAVPRRVNESIPEHVLRAISYIKESGVNPKAQEAIITSLIRSTIGEGSSVVPRRPWDNRSFTLPPYLREAIVDLFADDYRYIAESYVGAADKILFREPVKPISKTIAPKVQSIP